jgi:hypothetical protein
LTLQQQEEEKEEEEKKMLVETVAEETEAERRRNFAPWVLQQLSLLLLPQRVLRRWPISQALILKSTTCSVFV